MKTYSAKQSEIQRKWYIVDAKDMVLGRLATTLAVTLRGKNKPTFTPHLDCGDYVVVINAGHIRLTGKKETDKKYYSHSGYIGNLKTQTVKEVRAKKPTKILHDAVRGMIPRNKLRDHVMDKLKLYEGETHPHEAQQPEALSL
ncbi:MAG: 50S ribosomal protein L13 [Candidatus Peregrinibacteria bacterium]|nr:50S ribosomal protein L13 [Candidatus Peregrinibacteria bacterium]MDZ4245403.1 50S ribosomal protein L13 [Candidatus Gracilibacteria bacterium]